MKFYIEFTPFYDYNDKKLTLLYNKFPSLREEPIVNVHAICWLYNKDAIKGVVLCKHGIDALVLYKLQCIDMYDEKPFITLIRKYVGNDKRITLQAAAKDYDRLSSMVLGPKYTPVGFIKDDSEQTGAQHPIVEQQVQEPIDEVQETLNEQQEPMDEVQEPLNEQQEPIDEVQEPIDEVQEPIDGVQEPLNEQQEPLNEQQEPIDEVQEPIDEVQYKQTQPESNVLTKANKVRNDIYSQLENLLRVFGDIENKMTQYSNDGVIPREAFRLYEEKAFEILSNYPGKLLIVDPNTNNFGFDVSEYQKRFSAFKVSRSFKQVIPYNPPKVGENKLLEVMSKYPEVFESNQVPEDTNRVDSVIYTSQPETEKRKLDMVEEESHEAGVTYKIFSQTSKDASEFECTLGQPINKTEVIRLYEQFASLIGNRHAISMFDMNNHSNYKDFMNRNDGDKVVLITLYNGVPETFMLIGDLTEEKDKLKSVQITQLYSNLNFYKALTYCHFYKWYEQKNGTGSLIRLESPKNDLQFYKEMNMVVDEEWNVLYTGWNHRMAIVGKHIPPYERYKHVLHHTTEKRIKYSNTR